jgi:hypothetical protein
MVCPANSNHDLKMNRDRVESLAATMKSGRSAFAEMRSSASVVYFKGLWGNIAGNMSMTFSAPALVRCE